MKSATVLQMVRDGIVARGHDGLVSENRECACELSDLAPCGEISENCESGVKVPCAPGDDQGGCDGLCSFHIAAVRE